MPKDDFSRVYALKICGTRSMQETLAENVPGLLPSGFYLNMNPLRL